MDKDKHGVPVNLAVGKLGADKTVIVGRWNAYDWLLPRADIAQVDAVCAAHLRGYKVQAHSLARAALKKGVPLNTAIALMGKAAYALRQARKVQAEWERRREKA